MARKVFISFLGYSNYGACYYCKDGFKSLNGRYIQEATLDYLQTLEAWDDGDVAYILLTDGAKKANWLDDGHRDRDTHEIIRQPGLHTTLNSRNYPFVVQPVEGIPDGNDEKEIFEIFSRVFNLLQEGDRLYFDITHGFRYLPMLVLVLQNYAKFLKNIKVEAITYGNFEGRNKNTQEALIVDLLPLSNIQDWTFAAADYLENGNAVRIAKLAIDYSKPILKESKGQDQNAKIIRELAEHLSDLTKDLQMCRGQNIIKGDSIKKLRATLEKLDNDIIAPLSPIVKRIDSGISDFSSDKNVLNGLYASRWCLSNGLYQQSATILQESIISFFCYKYGLALNDKDMREIITKAFKYHECSDKSEFKGFEDEERVNIFELVVNDELIANKKVNVNYQRLQDLRNDINHNGMVISPRKADKIVSKLTELIDKFIAILNNPNNNELWN